MDSPGTRTGNPRPGAVVRMATPSGSLLVTPSTRRRAMWDRRRRARHRDDALCLAGSRPYRTPASLKHLTMRRPAPGHLGAAASTAPENEVFAGQWGCGKRISPDGAGHVMLSPQRRPARKTAGKPSARSLTDRALDYGSRGCRFESCRARSSSEAPSDHRKGPLTYAVTSVLPSTAGGTRSSGYGGAAPAVIVIVAADVTQGIIDAVEPRVL